jgi:prepilin-type N-terminal cleavage/methylation domain-containing protein
MKLPNRKRKGFTLIELLIAMAIFIIIIAVFFSSLSRFYTARAFYDQQLVLDQNFRFAMDQLTNEFRQSNEAPGVIGDIIVKPQDNAMEEELIFKEYDEVTTQTVEVRYSLVPTGTGRYEIMRATSLDFEVASPALITNQPVTEEMNQLVKLYFIRQGGKIVAVIVGKATYFGKENTVSFTSLIYSRNSAEEGGG